MYLLWQLDQQKNPYFPSGQRPPCNKAINFVKCQQKKIIKISLKKLRKKKSFHMIDIDIICSKKIERLNNKK